MEIYNCGSCSGLAKLRGCSEFRGRQLWATVFGVKHDARGAISVYRKCRELRVNWFTGKVFRDNVALSSLINRCNLIYCFEIECCGDWLILSDKCVLFFSEYMCIAQLTLTMRQLHDKCRCLVANITFYYIDLLNM